MKRAAAAAVQSSVPAHVRRASVIWWAVEQAKDFTRVTAAATHCLQAAAHTQAPINILLLSYMHVASMHAGLALGTINSTLHWQAQERKVAQR